MTVARAFAPGKLIVTGEHAVVYGHPALAMAIDRGTTVTLVRRPGPSGVMHSAIWDARLEEALRSVLPSDGVGVTIETDLPVGRGMGSSAALAVATVRALARLEDREATAEECIDKGFALERVFHGSPSGIDHTVAARGGALVYTRAPEGLRVEPFDMPEAPRWVVLDSGAAGNTADLVAGVRERLDATAPLLAQVGVLSVRIIEALRAGTPVGPLLTENHRLLADIGVSTPMLDSLVGWALAHGADGAKLAGAGGGGVVLACVQDPLPLLSAAEHDRITAFEVRVSPRV